MLIFKRSLALTLLLSALVGHLQPAMAQNLRSEQSIRAAMVFNFLKFTGFPPESVANALQLRLCVAVGDLRQAEALAELSGSKVAGRELVVIRQAGRADDCHVLFVDSRQRWNATIEQGFPQRALTISAYPGFVREGGMIEIALQEGGTRFDINLAEGRRAGFQFAPQLLRLARHVYE